MNDHRKKIAGAVGAAAAFIAYYAIFFGLIIAADLSRTVKMLLGIIPAALIFVIVYVCMQRIAEIKGGEEDDLGKY